MESPSRGPIVICDAPWTPQTWLFPTECLWSGWAGGIGIHSSAGSMGRSSWKHSAARPEEVTAISSTEAGQESQNAWRIRSTNATASWWPEPIALLSAHLLKRNCGGSRHT